MKQFLLISTIICALAVFMPGCGQAPDNQKTTTDQDAGDAANKAPQIEKTGEAVAPEAPVERPAKTDTAGTAAEIVESETKEKAAGLDTKPAVPVPAASGSTSVADVIEMKNTTAFSKHMRSIVMFGHKKHTAPAPDGYGISCGECHHDQDGKPLDLKDGEPVQGCIACHDKPDKPKKPAGMSAENWAAMQLEYYYGAIHANCIDCHKAGEAGPVKCNECHPRAEE